MSPLSNRNFETPKKTPLTRRGFLFLCVPGSDRLLDPDPRDNLFSVDESIVQVQLSEPRQIPRCQSHSGAAKMDTLRISRP